jgi:diguanylate cyclase (GGDEF)-like protein
MTRMAPLVGDAVLREMTRRLAAGVRPYDVGGRYGGEEFLIVFPGCNASNLVVGAERLRHCVADYPVETTAGQVSVTLSLGLGSAEQRDKETLDSDTFLHTADQALYTAKARARNRVESALATERAPPAPDLGRGNCVYDTLRRVQEILMS